MALLDAETAAISEADRAANRVCPVTVKLTQEEHRAVTEHAEEVGRARSEWMRDVILRELQTSPADPLLEEVVGIRLLLINVLRPLVKFIGKVEIERLRETHFDGTRSGHNFTIERQVEPLVLESEISGLPDLRAFIKYQNYVTYFSFPYFDMPEVAKPFELRERPDDRLPYDPKSVRAGRSDVSSEELKQEPEPSVATEPNEPAAAQSIQPEPAMTPDVHEEHAAVHDGWSL